MSEKIYLISSKKSNAALPYIEEAAAFLASNGITLRCLPEKSKFFAKTNITAIDKSDLSRVSAAIVFGGDGSILKTAGLLLDYGTPVLGINMGTVGYLADSEPKNSLDAVKKLVGGDYTSEMRSTLEAEIGGKVFTAINEAVVHRGALGHILSTNVKIDGQDVDTVRADGIIVSTPTGSTAYNLSAGGPLIAPLSHTFVLTPICAHSLTSRPIVVGDESVITLTPVELRTQYGLPSLDVDGQTVATVNEGEFVSVRLSSKKLNLVRTNPKSFYKTLQSKLGGPRSRK